MSLLAIVQANRENRMGAPVARDSLNYASVRVRALPPEAQLSAGSDLSVMEQLGMLLTIHAKTLISLFLDWDEDGNGGINKKEWRRAIAALQYKAPRAIIDRLFDELDLNSDGILEFHEMKQALQKYVGQKRVDSHLKRPPTPGSRPRTSSSSGSPLKNSSSSGLLVGRNFNYSWAKDHSARWPYQSYPSKSALQF